MNINTNTVAIVTGAASGIGRALAVRLSQAGAQLAIADVNEAELQATAKLVRTTCTTHYVDVSDEQRMQDFVQEVVAAHGRANLVINNAGVALLGTFAELSTADIAWLMGVNFWGVIYGTKYFLPVLQQQPAAHLVNISSIFGIIGFPGQSAYNASKFAVRGFTEALRHELEGSHVRISCVHPGGIKTNIARSARVGANAQAVQASLEEGHFEKLAPTTPEQAAERIVRGIERNEPRILIGADAGAMERLQRLFPVRYWRLLRPLMEWRLGESLDSK
ncbi:MAG: SDR family NAD(P)-dependent oxidoreductase [Acidobacteria bacterium]|nr:SDR family NAD(P)-dependent oxidoreductase [Acidobacteriota bacterium]MBI3426757.1 SDR family NAD(P)-dependent oxidoreductase [Acidobacteriota bacterium]